MFVCIYLLHLACWYTKILVDILFNTDKNVASFIVVL